MWDYEVITPVRSVKGLSIWSATVPWAHGQTASMLYVITQDTFYFADFRGRSGYHEALDSLRDGDDPDTALPSHALVVPLDDLVRAEKAPNDLSFSLRFLDGPGMRWRTIACPDGLGDELIRNLRQRLAPRLRFGKERMSIPAAAATPLGVLFGVILLTGFLLLGSLSSADSANETTSKSVRGSILLGRLLGPLVVLLLGGLACLGICGWGVFAVVARPMKKVLRDDALEQGTAGARSSPRSGRRGAAHGADPATLPFVCGIVAVGVSVPALGVSCLPWGSIAGLLFAVLGLVAAAVAAVLARSRRTPGLGLAIAGGSANVLALLVAFVVTLLSVVNLVSPMNKPPADSARPSVIAGWGRITDPDDDCTIEKDGDALALRVPATAHDLVVERNRMNAPRVLQEVNGDFRIEVQVTGSPDPNQPLFYQGAGLLLWVGKDDYIRLERVNQGGGPSLALEVRANGRVVTNQSVLGVVPEPYLCLERKGKQVLASWSADGRQWKPILALNLTLPDKVSVGVFGINTGGQALKVRFEKLRLDAK